MPPPQQTPSQQTPPPAPGPAGKSRPCTRCGRPVSLYADSWQLVAGQFAHAACPPSDEMTALPPVPAEATAEAEAAVRAARQAQGGRALPVFLTMIEAGHLLRVSKDTIRARIRTGQLPARRLTGCQAVLVELADVLALLEPYRGERYRGKPVGDETYYDESS